MAKKRGNLLPRPDVERDPREPVVIAATCEIGGRPPEDVVVIDLGLNGCRLRGDWLGVTKSEPLTLRIAGQEPIAAKLKWARKDSIGLAFDAPLDPTVLETLCGAAEADPALGRAKRRTA